MSTIKIEMETEEFMKIDNERAQLLELKGRVLSALEYIKHYEYSLDRKILLSILGEQTSEEEE